MIDLNAFALASLRVEIIGLIGKTEESFVECCDFWILKEK